MLELLKLPYETGRNYDVTLDLNTFYDMASRIETKIYDKSFSSFSAKRDGSQILLAKAYCLDRKCKWI